MELEKIQGLVKILEESSLTEMTVKEGDFKISMTKLDHTPVIQNGVSGGSLPSAGGAASLAGPAPAEAKQAEEADEDRYITAPIVGTYYSAPAPDAPAFVKVGDRVKNGQTVCILEAMKLMNEIQAESDCEIEAVLVSNEQKVEYGQPLFRVKKL